MTCNKYSHIKVKDRQKETEENLSKKINFDKIVFKNLYTGILIAHFFMLIYLLY